MWRLIFKDGHFTDNDILFGAVVAIGLDALNLVHHIHAFQHFAEDGVLAVQVGRAAHGGVGLPLLGRELEAGFAGHLRLGLLDQFVLQLQQSFLVAQSELYKGFR